LEPLEKMLEKITALEQKMLEGPEATGPPARTVRGSPAPPPSAFTGARTSKETKGSARRHKPSVEAPSEAPPMAEARQTEGDDTPTPKTPWNAPDAWKSFVETVRHDRAMTAALLEDADQWEVSANAVKVFCEKGSFLYDQLGHPETRTRLSRSARECFGDLVGFELWPAERLNDKQTAPLGEPEEKETQPTPSPVEEAQNDQVVKTALEVFHGTIKDVKMFGPEKADGEQTGSWGGKAAGERQKDQAKGK
jgi:hypothetical protein